MNVTDAFCDQVMLPAVAVFGLFLARARQAPAAEAPPPDPVEQERTRLRESAPLRLVSPAEEGSAFAALPPGVYGFTYAPATETPLFAKSAYGAFEVHKPDGGPGVVLAFVTADEARRIEAGEDAVDLKLYPSPWGEAKTLIGIPADRLRRSNAKATRAEGAAIEFRVLPK